MNDMTAVNTLDISDASLVDFVTPLNLFASASKSLQKALLKAYTVDQQLFDLRLAANAARDDVSAALNGNGDFEAASKLFKTANNKVDRMIDSRNATLKYAVDGIAAIRELLDNINADLKDLED